MDPVHVFRVFTPQKHSPTSKNLARSRRETGGCSWQGPTLNTAKGDNTNVESKNRSVVKYVINDIMSTALTVRR